MRTSINRLVRFASSFRFDFVLSSKCIPKNQSGSPCGQDSCLLFEAKDYEKIFLGVFDGVGGFEEAGIDSSEFSNSLMESCKEVIRNSYLNDLTAFNLLSQAYDRVCSAKKVKGGGTTACIALFDLKEGEIDCFNLGDSGLTILRYYEEEDGWRVHQKTSPQTHSFNFPYQLVVPKGAGGDTVKSGNQYYFEDVRNNDIILLATDGLTDNVFDEEIQEILGLLNEEEDQNIEVFIDSVSTKLVQMAYDFAVDSTKETPFSQEIGIAEMGAHQVLGGKIDDITLIMGIVLDSKDSKE